MTNAQIITGEMILNGIMEEVDTYAGWLRRGYQVQKGQKAKFQTKIWKPVKSKKDEDDTELILVKASFFAKSQVAAATA
ncbi:MAG: hypothetical protein LIO54_08360 [Oscillospiraceae bacterium]|nr:hypothetical protein [Oscillospiraceae bacterium]